MQNKTILHFTGMISTKYGGFEKFLLEFSKLCSTKGYKTVLQYEHLPSSKKYLSDLENNNIRVIVKPINTNPFTSVITITKLIKDVSPEIVQTHFINSFGLLACPFIVKMFNIQKIFHMQHLLSDFRKIPFIKIFFNRYNRIFCVSSAVAENLILAGVNPSIISINYLGLFGDYGKSDKVKSELREKFCIPAEATVLSCIAFDKPIKGVDILLNAFKRIVKDYPNVHLIIIGIDPKISNLYKLSNKLGLSSFVHWLGIIDHAIEILGMSDIYVQPSLKEGLSLAIIEAMALGLPVVATNIGGIREVVIDGETGYLTDPGNEIALAEAIKRLLSDRLQMKIFGENGYHHYQQMFKGENSIKNLLNLYNIS
ncbi:MAG: glycosyltransferase family 4 protein [Candidatus Thermoplasmatota archaeon]|jgi:glycosyltransferase involved in cell wall biosynthesis|nr:glycosyltransferase family 4 protein [Candidatus Thermoplasmatota archaeon]